LLHKKSISTSLPASLKEFLQIKFKFCQIDKSDVPPPISIVTTFSVNGIFCPAAKYNALEILSVKNLVFSCVLKLASPRPTLTDLLVILLNALKCSDVYASG
jgi:hypothetical protein